MSEGAFRDDYRLQAVGGGGTEKSLSAELVLHIHNECAAYWGATRTSCTPSILQFMLS